ncbi:MAG: DUF4382 domain-containing protein [Flavobacteriales bacterium]
MSIKDVVAIIGLIAAIAACDKQNFISITNEASQRSSSIQVTMHDTAGPYANVYVNIERVSIHRSDTDSLVGWTDLNVNPGFYDLLELQNGLDSVLVNQTMIGAGHVTQMRFLLGEGNHVILLDSTLLPLNVPSGMQSGIKLNLNHEFEPFKVYDITIDFDVMKSIHVTGNGKYQLKPVIKVESVVEI